jgi:hypothetical protein
VRRQLHPLLLVPGLLLCLPLALPAVATLWDAGWLLPAGPPGTPIRTELPPISEARPTDEERCLQVLPATALVRSRPFQTRNHMVHMWHRGALSVEADLPRAPSPIVVWASGTSAGGVPAQMRLLVDEQEAGRAFVGPELAPHTFVARAAGKRTITLEFTNDAQIAGEDRNLLVSHLMLQSPAPAAATPVLSPDRLLEGIARAFAPPPPDAEALEIEIDSVPQGAGSLRLRALDAQGAVVGSELFRLLPAAASRPIRLWLPRAELPETTASVDVRLSRHAKDELFPDELELPPCAALEASLRLSALSSAGPGPGWTLALSYVLLPGLLLAAPARLGQLGLGHVFSIVWLSFLYQGLLAWALVALGWFHPALFAGGVLSGSLASLALRRLRPEPWVPGGQGSPRSMLALVPLLVLAWYVRAPNQTVLGASDTGTYVNMSANLVMHGRVQFERTDLRSLPPEERTVLYQSGRMSSSPQAGTTFAGYYLMSDLTEIAQFPFLYPALLARMAAAIGLQQGLLWNGYVGLLGLLAFTVLVQAVWGLVPALLGATALSLSFGQVWAALESFTEPSTQAMLFGGLAWWMHWDRTDSRRAALLGGLALGGMLALRIDAFTLYPGLLCLLGLRLWGRRADAGDAVAWGSFLGMATLGLYVAWTQLPAYTSDVFHSTIFSKAPWLEPRWQWVSLAGLGAGAGTMWLLGRHVGAPLAARLAQAAGVLLAAAALWAYFLRPEAGNLHAEQANLVRLSWYLGELGLWLGVAGLAGLVAEIRDRRSLTVIVCLLMTTLLYLQGSRITQVHPYWSRRFVVTAIPLAALSAGWLLARLGARPGGLLPAGLLLAGLLGGSAVTLRPLEARPFHAGLYTQLQALAQEIPADAALLVLHDGKAAQIAVPLRHIFGRDAYLAAAGADVRPVAGRWIRQGRRVLVLRTDAVPPGARALAETVPVASFLLRHAEIGVDWRVHGKPLDPLEHLFTNRQAVHLYLHEIRTTR